jgi:hypothetical protein
MEGLSTLTSIYLYIHVYIHIHKYAYESFSGHTFAVVSYGDVYVHTYIYTYIYIYMYKFRCMEGLSTLTSIYPTLTLIDVHVKVYGGSKYPHIYAVTMAGEE